MIYADYHTHSEDSRGGILSYDALYSKRIRILYASKIGLNCLSFTEHDTLKGLKDVIEYGKRHNVIIVPGVEIKKKMGKRFWEEKHVIGLGIKEEPPSELYGKSIFEICDWIKDQNGVVYIPHPYSIYGLNYFVKEKCVDVVEVFNSNTSPFPNLRASLAAKRWKKASAAGSDSHIYETLGNVVNEMNSEENVDDILENLKKGKNIIIKRKNKTVPQYKKWEIERFRKSRNSVEKYINEKIPVQFQSVVFKLLYLTLENDWKPHVLWNSVILGIYAGDFVYNAFGLIKDLLV